MRKHLGKHAKDIVTGFEGTVTACVTYLTGYDQVLLTPLVDKEGKHVEPMWKDINRVEFDENYDQIILDTEKEKGADIQAPKK